MCIQLRWECYRRRSRGNFCGTDWLWAALGCAAGISIALPFTRLLAGMLYGVSPTDPAAFSGVVIIVLSVSLLDSLLPALGAPRLQPMQVLREE